MPRYKLTLEYAGTRYSGWQVQKNARTVQGELMHAVREATGQPPIELYGAGRTDAGVHALGQVAHLEIRTGLPPESLRRKINDALPADIREPMRQVLSVTLRGVIAQRLCLRANGEGRVALLEILLQTHGVANLIRENKVHQIEGLLQSASADGTGSQSLDACILRYVQEGLVTREDGLAMADRPDQLQRQLADLPEDR